MEAARIMARDDLSWSHYCLLMQVDDSQARDWYMREAASQQWSTRQLKRHSVLPRRSSTTPQARWRTCLRHFEVCKCVVRNLLNHFDAVVLIRFKAPGLCAAFLPVSALCTNTWGLSGEAAT